MSTSTSLSTSPTVNLFQPRYANGFIRSADVRTFEELLQLTHEDNIQTIQGSTANRPANRPTYHWIVAPMAEILKTVQLPTHYFNDVGIDYAYITNTADKVDNFLWILRPNGSNLIPLSVGAHDAEYQVFYKEQSPQEKAKVRLYQISTKSLMVTPIDEKQADSLLNRKPMSGHTGVVEGYADIMRRGIDLGLWCMANLNKVGIYENAKAWEYYFHTNGNKNMVKVVNDYLDHCTYRDNCH